MTKPENSEIVKWVRFPGILLIGILLLSFSLLRQSHWKTHEIIPLAGIGLIISLIGIELRIRRENSSLSIMGAAGAAMTTFSILLYTFIVHEGTDALSLLAAVGLSLQVSGIMQGVVQDLPAGKVSAGRREPVVPEKIPMSDEVVAFEHQLSNAKKIFQGYRSKVMDDIGRRDEQFHQYIMFLLKLRDGFEKLRSEGDTHPIIRASDSEIEEMLLDLNVREMSVKPGDAYNYLIHELLKNSSSAQESSGTIEKLVRKGYVVRKPDGGEEILRKPLVVLR